MAGAALAATATKTIRLFPPTIDLPNDGVSHCTASFTVTPVACTDIYAVTMSKDHPGEAGSFSAVTFTINGKGENADKVSEHSYKKNICSTSTIVVCATATKTSSKGIQTLTVGDAATIHGA